MDQLSVELAMKKFGEAALGKARDVCLDAVPVLLASLPELVKTLHKIISGASRKYCTEAVEGSACGIVHDAFTKLLKAPPAEEKLQTEQAQDKKAPEDASTAVVPAASHTDSADIKWEVGTIVLTSFGNQKEKYDGFKAEITKVLSQKVIVKMLEGAAVGTPGEIKEFNKSKLLPWGSENVTEPPAGQSLKRTSKEAGLDSSGAALADSIFGKVPAPAMSM